MDLHGGKKRWMHLLKSILTRPAFFKKKYSKTAVFWQNCFLLEWYRVKKKKVEGNELSWACHVITGKRTFFAKKNLVVCFFGKKTNMFYSCVSPSKQAFLFAVQIFSPLFCRNPDLPNKGFVRKTMSAKTAIFSGEEADVKLGWNVVVCDGEIKCQQHDWGEKGNTKKSKNIQNTMTTSKHIF